jgi:hypothetical protein
MWSINNSGMVVISTVNISPWYPINCGQTLPN